ncbi:exported protein of unknown function (plasmid) [Azospirillum baldaniorum]|uniref:Filamentous haemagglutinin FhaB/tRNA nuclease CdiA-like TPS domain-containing protein n=1 Tax=Azospirillum baldaniorum TaxID=1064539 RepID=A0A9P1NSH8_9PROT|nr:exported protein of unknown function [Azospirillum baldaniorum]
MRRRLLLTPVVALLSPAAALAQIATDGTTGPRVSLSGKVVEIGASLGTQAGGNLFHSFDRFNVNQGQTVTFTGPGNVRNVVGRVTGGSPSAIDGTLRSTVGQADVHLINPAGMTFGPNAVVDVPASLHVGTAHEVRFADGARFSALDTGGSSFTASPPAAFGFLDRPAGALKVDGARVSVKPGKALSLVGGDVEVRGGATGRVEAPGGSVTVASLTGSGQVRLADGAVNAVRQGKVRLHDGASIASSGDGGGSVLIRGDSLTVENATVAANNTGGADAKGSLDVRSGSLDIAGGALISVATGSGLGAPISLQAADVTLRGGARVSSIAFGPGRCRPDRGHRWPPVHRGRRGELLDPHRQPGGLLRDRVGRPDHDRRRQRGHPQGWRDPEPHLRGKQSRRYFRERRQPHHVRRFVGRRAVADRQRGLSLGDRGHRVGHAGDHRAAADERHRPDRQPHRRVRPRQPRHRRCGHDHHHRRCGRRVHGPDQPGHGDRDGDRGRGFRPCRRHRPVRPLRADRQRHARKISCRRRDGRGRTPVDHRGERRLRRFQGRVRRHSGQHERRRARRHSPRQHRRPADHRRRRRDRQQHLQRRSRRRRHGDRRLAVDHRNRDVRPDGDHEQRRQRLHQRRRHGSRDDDRPADHHQRR